MTGTPAFHEPDKQELRKFGLIFAGMFILVFVLLLPWIWGKPAPMWAWIVAAVFAASGLLVPMALGPVYRLWMKIGHVLGWVNTRIILGLVFFTVFLPFGLIMRLFNDPMKRKLDDASTSYRVASHSSPRDQMERPF